MPLIYTSYALGMGVAARVGEHFDNSDELASQWRKGTKTLRECSEEMARTQTAMWIATKLGMKAASDACLITVLAPAALTSVVTALRNAALKCYVLGKSAEQALVVFTEYLAACQLCLSSISEEMREPAEKLGKVRSMIDSPFSTIASVNMDNVREVIVHSLSLIRFYAGWMNDKLHIEFGKYMIEVYALVIHVLSASDQTIGILESSEDGESVEHSEIKASEKKKMETTSAMGESSVDDNPECSHASRMKDDTTGPVSAMDIVSDSVILEEGSE